MFLNIAKYFCENILIVRLESEKETGSVAEGEVYIQLSNQTNNQPLSSQVSYSSLANKIK